MKFLVASCLLALTDTQLCLGQQTIVWDISERISCCPVCIKLLLYFFTQTLSSNHKPRHVHYLRGLAFCCFILQCSSHLSVLVVDGSAISLTYIASERIIPGCVGYALKSHTYLFLLHSFIDKVLKCLECRYGGGMSSAKAALESDTRVSFLSLFFKLLYYTHRYVHFSHLNFPFSPSPLNIWNYISSFLPLQVLAFEAGRKKRIRVNTISAGIDGFLWLH